MAAYVYILASKKNGTLYIGVSSDLVRRIYEHKQHTIEGFSRKYNVTLLVYFEVYDDILTAIEREKKLKKYKRDYKINLITRTNPQWRDLYEDIAVYWIPEQTFGLSRMTLHRDRGLL